MTPDVRIYEFTDPGCPWAWSAEPFRRRLDWLYGDRIEWQPADGGPLGIARGVPREGLHAREASRGRSGGSPASTGCRSTPASAPGWWPRVPACRAVVADARPRPRRASATCSGGCGSCTSAAVCSTSPRRSRAPRPRPGSTRTSSSAGRPSPRSSGSCAPTWPPPASRCPAARVLDERLANWSGGRRYTCPSYEIVRLADGVTDLDPGLPAVRRLRRRSWPTSCPGRPPRASARRGRGAGVGRGAARLAGGRDRARRRARRGARAAQPGRRRGARRRRRVLDAALVRCARDGRTGPAAGRAGLSSSS